MSTRRYPRTLDEAFPHGPRYGCAIERPAARAYSLAWWVCMGIIAVLTVMLCWGGRMMYTEEQWRALTESEHAPLIGGDSPPHRADGYLAGTELGEK